MMDAANDGKDGILSQTVLWKVRILLQKALQKIGKLSQLNVLWDKNQG